MSRRSRGGRRGEVVQKALVPRAGPGVIYVQELVSGDRGRERRYRNIGEHPLTLAHERRKITSEQFAAGEEVRLLHELCALRGRDSTQMTPGSAGDGSRASVTDVQLDARRRLERLRARLKERDWIIVEKFCGEGWSMAEAVRAATVCHPSGVVHRVQEALDELVAARGAPRLAKST